MTEATIEGCLVRIVRDDITLLDVDAFVFAARSDLALGSGFGTAIALRGGPSIQAELKTLAPVTVGNAVISGAGKLKAKQIIHVVAPAFLEDELDAKLSRSVASALQVAERHGVTRLALPPIGVGFYGIPAEVCARVTMTEVARHLRAGSRLREVILCVRDEHDVAPFAQALDACGT